MANSISSDVIILFFFQNSKANSMMDTVDPAWVFTDVTSRSLQD